MRRLLTRSAALSALTALVTIAPSARAQNDTPGAEKMGDNVPSGKARAITPPRLTTFVEAPYPEEEKATGKQATVVLQIAITEKGTVAAVVVLESGGAAFDAAAVAAARQFVFEPALADAKAIPVKINYRYDFVIKVEQVKRTTADFSGLVRERSTKKPLAGINVALETGQSATTDENGKFAIPEIAPGNHAVTLSGDKLVPVGTQETFEASKALEATYDVELKSAAPSDDDTDFEVVVTAPKLGKQVVSTEITATQATKVPGTQGDVLKVVENLPGVARSAVGSGQIIVWGAAPEDTRVYVDGVRVPRLYHDGGYRSIVHSDMVRSVELVPGGYGATYGRGLGGLVTVQLRPMDDDKVHGSLGADIVDASGAISAPLGERWHVAAAVRKSYLDSTVKAFTRKDVGDIVPLPQYFDSQARLQYTIDKGSTMELGGLVSSDSIDRTVTDSDPSQVKRENKRLGFGRVWLRYEKKLTDGQTITILPSWGKDSARTTDRFGATPAALSNDADVLGLRASWRGQPYPWLSVHAGVDADFSFNHLRRAGSITTPPREGDVRIFGEPPADQVNVDEWRTVTGSVAPFVETDIALFSDKLHVVPGARFEPYLTSVNRSVPVTGDKPAIGLFSQDSVVEPRLAVRYQALPQLTVKAAVGQYHQSPQTEDLSAVFGNPRLGLSSATHVLGGGAVKITSTLTAETTGFYSGSESLTSRSAAATPLLANALVQEGIGRSYGAQVLLRQEQIGPLFGWVSYSLIRSERKDHPNSAWRAFDYDQTHVFTSVAAVDLGHGFEAGLRFRFASGFPRTPVIASYRDTRTGQWEPVFGQQNSVRIPAFYSLDARVAKHFKLGKTDAEAYLDVQNVTNHENAEELFYNYDYTRRYTISGLPILPVLGLKWSF
jgi:TonB family protein